MGQNDRINRTHIAHTHVTRTHTGAYTHGNVTKLYVNAKNIYKKLAKLRLFVFWANMNETSLNN